MKDYASEAAEALYPNTHHLTLRTIFDNLSAEWKMTSMEQKAVMLSALIAKRPLTYWIKCFEDFHRSKQRDDIARATSDSVADILEYLLKNYKPVEN